MSGFEQIENTLYVIKLLIVQETFKDGFDGARVIKAI